MAFTVGDVVEAIDLVGVWSRGKVTAIENSNITVGFDGYGHRHNRTMEIVMAEENIRLPTTEPEYSCDGKRRRIDEDIKVLFLRHQPTVSFEKCGTLTLTGHSCLCALTVTVSVYCI